jgi:hypothetical protein
MYRGQYAHQQGRLIKGSMCATIVWLLPPAWDRLANCCDRTEHETALSVASIWVNL